MPNQKVQFFVDTANVQDVNKIFDKVWRYIDSDSVMGITTNPSALAKVKCASLTELEELIHNLGTVLYQYKGDRGIIYIQIPNSDMPAYEIFKWAEYIFGLNTAEYSIGLKLPHFTRMLELTQFPEINKLHPNITGIADAGTILKATSYENVTAASIITGRMDEVGINSEQHIKFLANMANRVSNTNIIAGSMRTVDGLKTSIKYSCIPTIGSRVWSIIDDNNLWEQFPTYWTTDDWSEVENDYIPEITKTNIELSREFFFQMNMFGKELYDSFKKRILI